ncbi:FAD-dependent oxidoreductase [Lysobacter sp. KIS68-7]|uniref:FAD-dependent oxidoreductase n=1 Tax=Lysobacter sp. KIS68-7 TaxID=2904252 RepID=UPI001E630502|nr:FAD-dependent oxidoreductase [Lysobacter sp. KIS68-7]UHQ19840.1 FAD-dependent oxidoreductase [Lysobacter sp. KIS68-7]
MGHSDTPPPGPDFAQGVALSSVPAAGVLAGHVDGEAVLLARLDDGLHAVSGTCTHWSGTLGEGRVEGDVVHCPLHHACFSLRTGRALKAPAFAPLDTWCVEVEGDKVFVRAKQDIAGTRAPGTQAHPQRIVIVGGGAAGFAAATRLRELGFEGALTMLSADHDPPCDRPNLSKDFLAGNAPPEWIPLQPDSYYTERRIDLRLRCDVSDIDTTAREVVTGAGERFGYDALLLATGAEPVRLPTPGFDRPNVFMLRTLQDASAIVAAAKSARTVALVGAGFIGMEAAGALRARGLDVHVIAREEVPLERVFGRDFGNGITDLHRAHGVNIHLKATAASFDGASLTLEDGARIPADLLIVGVGVKPRTQLAERAGLQVQDGILVDALLQTSTPGIWAAGDVARYPLGEGRARIEHWVHAERQGQTAAANMLGAKQVFDDVPFFWTYHQGHEFRYTGHAEQWDDLRVDGSVPDGDCTARFYRGGRLLAAASVGRDVENLEIEAQLRG